MKLNKIKEEKEGGGGGEMNEHIRRPACSTPFVFCSYIIGPEIFTIIAEKY